MHASAQTAIIACVLGSYAAVMFLQGRVEHLAHERRFAAAAHACDHREYTQRELDIQVLQVVLGSTDDLDIVAPRSALRRYNGGKILQARFAYVGYLSAVTAGFRSDLYHIVGSHHYILVVLHDHDRVAQVAQFVQHVYEPLCVACVQTDGRFVQHIE